MTADDDYEQALEYVAECKKELKLNDGMNLKIIWSNQVHEKIKAWKRCFSNFADDVAALERKTPWSQNTKVVDKLCFDC